MPDSYGLLTPDERTRATAWFNRWRRGHNCPVGLHSDWKLVDHVVQPTLSSPLGGTMLGGASYPMVMLACGVCGYTEFINATLTGIVPRQEG